MTAREAGRPRTLEHPVRRGEILRAAGEAFAEKGFHATRIEDVALRAQVAQGTIYRFFTSKEELALSLLETGVTYLDGLVTDAIAESEAKGDRSLALGLFLDRAAEFYHRHRNELTSLHSWSLEPANRKNTKGLDDALAERLGLLVEWAGSRLWQSEDVDFARLVLLLLYSLSSQLEEPYGAAKGGGELIARLIKKVLYVDTPIDVARSSL
jgi:AcrR family transcriptional regulator